MHRFVYVCCICSKKIYLINVKTVIEVKCKKNVCILNIQSSVIIVK